LNKSLSLSQQPLLQQSEIINKRTEKISRSASFSVSGFPASGLLLFLSSGGVSWFFAERAFQEQTLGHGHEVFAFVSVQQTTQRRETGRRDCMPRGLRGCGIHSLKCLRTK
jgi:hypothetical protein